MNKKIIIKPGLGYLDTIFSDLCLPTIKFWKCLNFTPNQLTCLGLYSSIISLYFIYKKNIKYSVIFLIIRAYFDFIDGQFARKYEQVTQFGDYFDHLSDIFYFISMIIILSFKAKNKNLILILLLFGALFLAQMGCSEKLYREMIKNKTETSISRLRFLCFESKFLNIFDNCMLYISMIYVIIKYCNEK